jgi:lysozyme
MTHLSQAGRAVLKGYETGGKMKGKVLILLPKGEPALKTYVDDVGVKTIGWGHTGPVRGKKLTLTTTITRDEAEQLLSVDIAEAEAVVTSGCIGVPTTQNQFDAMVLFAFNVGVAAFKASTLLKRHKAGQYALAAKQFALWNKGTVNGKKVVLNGLTSRRAVEAAIYLRTEEPVSVKAPAPAPAKVGNAKTPSPTVIPTVMKPSVVSDVTESRRATPDAPAPVSTSKGVIGAALASVSAIPLTIGNLTTATDSLRQVKAQAESVQQFAWLSSAMGIIIFLMSAYIIWMKFHARREGDA